MIYDVSSLAVIIFVVFVALVLLLSFYFAGKTKTASGYFAAGGTIHWGVNGIAFAGDYLSAASFLGIAGMIAFAGYDGFLYSIGFLAGLVVALFVVAEPMKRMGTFTFTDALDHKYNSRSIKFTAAISTLVVSIFYLIPQMVGAGDLVVPIPGLPHWAGVVIVGSVVIFIVATAGMTSTTYVQFLKGGLLIIFSVVLTFYVLRKGLETEPNPEHHHYISLAVTNNPFGEIILEDDSLYVIKEGISAGNDRFFLLEKDGINNWFHLVENDDGLFLNEMLTIVTDAEGNTLYNGAPRTERLFYQVGHVSRVIADGEEVESSGPANPFNFLTRIEDSEIVR